VPSWFPGAIADSTADTSLLQYGAIGVFLVIALGAVRALYKQLAQRESDAYEREKARADRLEAELAKLNEAIQQRYLTTLNEATRAVADSLTKMRRG